MKLRLLAAGIGLLIASSVMAQSSARWQSLFNGKDLTGWETYLDKPYAKDGENDKTPPIGLNKDPNHVFSVVMVDGKPALRISGETFGGINTLADYGNYHLRMEFKWGTQKWPPKLDRPRDSGLLYHSVGPHGTPMLWMESFELQVQEGDCGDYWGVMNVLADITARKNEKGYVYDPASPLITFQDKTPIGRSCLKNPDAEKPSGQWNVLELYCFGDTSVHVMNGKVNLVLTKTRHLVNGQAEPLTKGKIQIQSEGAEVFYRNIQIQPIGQLPVGLVK
ncbi:3-keto-disaccharide hydrolase [Spirosoma aerophilum]